MKKPNPVKEIPIEVQRRLDALESLIDSTYDGKVKTFSDKTGIGAPQVNQWFTGYRMLRENAVKRLEQATGKPAGWFDAPAEHEPARSLAVIAPMTLRQTLERLAYFLGESPPDKREIIGSMLDRLAKHPHDKATIDLMLPWMAQEAD